MVYYNSFSPLTSNFRPYNSLASYNSYSYPYSGYSNYSAYGYPSNLTLNAYPNTLSTAAVWPRGTATDLLKLRTDPARLPIIPKDLLEGTKPVDNSQHNLPSGERWLGYHKPDQDKPYFPRSNNLMSSNMFSNFFSELFTSPQNYQYILPNGRIGAVYYNVPPVNTDYTVDNDKNNQIIYDAKKARGDNPVFDIAGRVYDPNKITPTKISTPISNSINTTYIPDNIFNTNNQSGLNDIFSNNTALQSPFLDNYNNTPTNNLDLPLNNVFSKNSRPFVPPPKLTDNPLAAPFNRSEYNDYTGTILGEYYHTIQAMQESFAEITKVKVPYIGFDGKPVPQELASLQTTGGIPAFDPLAESYGWMATSPYYKDYVTKHIQGDHGGVHDVITPRGFKPEDLFAGGRLTLDANSFPKEIYKSKPFVSPITPQHINNR